MSEDYKKGFEDGYEAGLYEDPVFEPTLEDGYAFYCRLSDGLLCVECPSYGLENSPFDAGTITIVYK